MKRTTLRTRLLAAFLLVSIGVLAAAGITAYVLARRAAESTALSDLQDRAPEIAQSLTNVATGAAPRLNDRVLSRLLVGAIRISTGSIVRVTPDGQVVTGVDALTPRQAAASNAVSSSSELLDLPPGITAADIDPQTLLTGEQTSGTHDNMVFVAQPIGTSDQALVNRGRLVLVLTAEVDRRPFGRAGAYLVVAGGVALALAIGASYLLARRLTRPLAAMQATASQMASGDLSARVRLADSSPEELARLGDTLNSMAAQMEHARGLERAFLLSVSHDLRTPLTSIRGYSEAIVDGTVQGEDARIQAATIIGSESRRLERLVADLLDLARLDAHEFSLHPRDADAATVVSAAVEAFRPAANDLGIELVVDAPYAVPAHVDPERLGQVVANLVENALKYATRRITVSVGADARELDVRVVDDGPGIDPAEAPHVFERLYTSRTSPGRQVGTGLGLAIVHELTAAMGGNAWVQPAEGGGTRFVVRMPVVRVTAPG